MSRSAIRPRAALPLAAMAVCLPFALSACGQKGPLYLPDKAGAEVPKSAPAAGQSETQKQRDEEKQPPR